MVALLLSATPWTAVRGFFLTWFAITCLTNCVCSGCSASRYRAQHREADREQVVLHEHVYRLGYGYGRDLRQRAVIAGGGGGILSSSLIITLVDKYHTVDD